MLAFLGPTRPVPRAVPGFPKKLPCLVCSRSRRSTWPGDRIHAACRKARMLAASGLEPLTLMLRTNGNGRAYGQEDSE